MVNGPNSECDSCVRGEWRDSSSSHAGALETRIIALPEQRGEVVEETERVD
jgi:hypothetical protein